MNDLATAQVQQHSPGKQPMEGAENGRADTATLAIAFEGRSAVRASPPKAIAAAAGATLLGMSPAMNAIAIAIRYRFRKKINW